MGFAMCFAIKFLTLIDTYDDFAFIFVSETCGTTLYIPAIIVYSFGVLLAQYSMGACIATALYVQNPWYLFLRICHLDVFCAALDFSHLTRELSNTPTRQVHCYIFVARFLCEDLAMGVVQLVFMKMYGVSPFVLWT